ncbi:MAG: AI-2E family transporter [Methanomicrobiales archaeon]|nr:AI-2E family transporter [Methanomicrobiales archaeon]
MTHDPLFSGPARTLLLAAAVVVVLAGMKAASPILGPLFFAVFLAVIFGMLLHWLRTKGYSRRVALLVTLAVFIAIIAVFTLVIAGSLLRLLASLPLYRGELERNLEMAGPILSGMGIETPEVSGILRSLQGSLPSVAGSLLDMAVAFGIIILTTLFLLFEAGGFSANLRKIIAEYRPGDLDRFTQLAKKNMDYLVIRTIVNLVMGIGTAIILWLIGVDYAVFWGFLAFLLGFVPYVGFWLAIIPPMLLAWVEISPVAALLVLVGEGAVNLLAEYLLFPHMAGRGLDLSTTVVFISLIFWGWILGGFGVLLAVPLTLTVRMLCELFEGTRWIAVLLGPGTE